MNKYFYCLISIFLTIFFISSCITSEEAGDQSENGNNVPLYKANTGPFNVSIIYSVWTDNTRSWDDNGTLIPNREIPIKIYAPDLIYDGTFPLILVSHGLGGNTDSITYMAEHLASYGYIVITVQHHRSDTKYLNDHGYLSLLAAASEPVTRQLRMEDMSFVIDNLILQNHSIDLIIDRINTSLIGAMGHSFGAFTTLSLIGQKFDGLDYSDNRVLCGVAYSPQGEGIMGLDNDSWDNMNKPIMTMAGTEDTSPGTDDPLTRREPFDNMPAGNKYHATLDNAEHKDFGDGSDFYHEWIIQMTMAFFDAYLLNNTIALDWLGKKNIEKITSYVTLESK